MTFEEAIAQQPAWIGYWLKWLLFGAIILPFALLIWRRTRIAAGAAAMAGLVAIFCTGWLYDQMGYVKLLGLPHIIVWTPLAIYLYSLLRRPDVPAWPKRIIVVVLVTILISLAFDYADAARYLLGERTPLARP